MENLLSKVYLGPMSVLWPLEGREVADWAYLGIGDLDVLWAPMGVPWPWGVPWCWGQGEGDALELGSRSCSLGVPWDW